MERPFDFFDDARADKTCLITPKDAVTYNQLFQRVIEIKEVIHNTQIAILVFDQDIQCVAFYLSCVMNGVPLILIDGTYTSADIKALIQRFEVDSVAGCAFNDVAGQTLYEKDNFFIYKTGKKSDIGIHASIAILVSTSGSLQNAKFVKLSRENLICNTSQILRYLPINATDTAMPPPPFSYVYGLSVLNTHLSVGAKILLCNDSVLSKEYWSFVSQYNITNINGVPYYYDIIKRLNGLARLHAEPKFLTQAGGRMSESTKRYLIDYYKEPKLYIMYGQSEATARISYLVPQLAKEKENCIGVAVPEGKITIENNEIVYYGPNIFMGYANSRKDLSYIEKREELHTGDCGHIGSDGLVYIEGRKSRFVKMMGKRLSLDICEAVLNNAGYECAVIATEECIHVFIVGSYDKRKVAELLKIPIVAFEATSIDALPRSHNGKVKYGMLHG